ncbi:cysteine proteinase inhibitor 5-like [Typha angustifolia]|uniref:cysteine proteinase inhibitor 5-like n=1 Tax=Typha angustifolia TaxID=59011 RepID=UPI003C2C15EC
MKSLSLLLLLPLLLILASSSHVSAKHPRRALVLGGWKAIKNISDPHVQELGEYAVAEHNKAAKPGLVFEKVVKGETQVVSGVNYRLVVEAKDGGGATGEYEAVVWEKTWEGFKQLISFKPVKN